MSKMNRPPANAVLECRRTELRGAPTGSGVQCSTWIPGVRVRSVQNARPVLKAVAALT